MFLKLLEIDDVDIDAQLSLADTFRKYKEKKLAENPTRTCAKVIF